MIRAVRWGWSDLLELAPHLVCAVAMVPFKVMGSEQALLSPPGWVKAFAVMGVLTFLPLCFLSGRSFCGARRPIENRLLVGYYALFALLSGVTTALLAVSAHLESVMGWFDASTFAELFYGPAAVGGALGLMGYSAGHFSRKNLLARR